MTTNAPAPDPRDAEIAALRGRVAALEAVERAAREASALRLFIEIYEGRVMDKPRGLRILDALDAALAAAEVQK